MKIQCDVCEKAPATIICCADEAALCAACDVQVHAANKLASKHQRLSLQCLSNKLPRCDICQEKTAFIFCVEDRALFCQDCDGSVHVEGSLSANHQRLLATGIHVALASACSNKAPAKNSPEPSKMPTVKAPALKDTALQQTPQAFSPSSWAVDDFFQLSDYECGDKRGSPIGFGELEWLADIGLFQQQSPDYTLSTAEVPELSSAAVSNNTFCKPPKSNMILKKPRFEIPEDDEDSFFTVPDLG